MVIKTPQVKPSSLRLLVLTPVPESTTFNPSITVALPPFADFLQVLTGSKPSQDITSFAGYTSHPALHIKTKYYETEVSLWCDEIPPLESKPLSSKSGELQTAEDTNTSSSDYETPITSLAEWQDQMLSDPAHEVRQVIGGIILLLPFITTPTSSVQQKRQISTWATYIESLTTLRDAIEDQTGREIASIALLQDQTKSGSISASRPTTISTSTSTTQLKATETLLDTLEEECLSSRGIIGWDYTSWNVESSDLQSTSDSNLNFDPSLVDVSAIPPATRNEYGEKTGTPRVQEVLEGIDWFASSGSFSDDEEENKHENENDEYGLDDIDEILAETSLSEKKNRNGIGSGRGNEVDLSSQPLIQHTTVVDEEGEEFKERAESTTTNTTTTTIPQVQSQAQPPLDPFMNPSLEPNIEHTGPINKKISPDDIWSTLDSPSSPPTPSSPSLPSLPQSQFQSQSSFQSHSQQPSTQAQAQVDTLPNLLERLISTREAASELSGQERRDFAKSEVQRLMREMEMEF